MNFENPTQGDAHPVNSMSFRQLEESPEYAEVLQEKALKFLMTENSEYFNHWFTGELDEDGYLIQKDGSAPRTKPSQNIGGGKPMEKILLWTKNAIRDSEAK